MSLPAPLLAVTDRHGHRRPLPLTVRSILAGGGRWIWFRDRDLPADERRRLGEAVAVEVREAGGVLSVGGDVALAAELGAGGVHLAGGSGPGDVARARDRLGVSALVGVSAHAPGEIEALAAAGVDYVTLSPIFPTSSKPGYGPALGPAGLSAARIYGLPVMALGGVEVGSLAACRCAGANGFAVMGGVMSAEDPVGVIQGLLEAWTAAAPAC